MMNILLPTDFSKTAMNAATFAMDLYGAKNVRYTLLNVYLKPAYRNFLISLNVDTERASRNGLRRMERRCRLHLPGARISIKSSFAPLDSAIRDLHAAGRADLVVMGTQGEGSYGLVGHNTTLAVTGGKVPVIAVPDQWRPAPLERILLADDAMRMDAGILAPLVAMAKQAKARVEVVHIVKEGRGPSGREALMHVLLADIPHDYSVHVAPQVETALDALAVQRQAQLVAVVRRDRGLLGRLFKGSHSKRMALHTSVPLLVLHEQD
jgi:nucleotide-binding universal stress UspA family protein